MLKFHADKFVELSNYFVKVSTVTEFVEGDFIPKASGNETLPQRLDNMKDICEEIGLDFSAKHVEKVKKQLLSDRTSLKDFMQLLNELESRISDELSNLSVMLITRKKADYYEQASLFGNGVFNRFPMANFDIEEAGKCFATVRHTACVMHLQRVLEIGLKGFGNYLNAMASIKSAQPSWQNVLEVTAKEIKNRTSTKTWTSSSEQMYAEGIQAFLVAVKTAWRNPSMHADAKYTEEVAEDIFNSVKGFMRHLAKHLDEKGDFTP